VELSIVYPLTLHLSHQLHYCIKININYLITIILFLQYLEEVERYEGTVGEIVLDPSLAPTATYFSTLQPQTISPAYMNMYHKKALLIVRMLEGRIGTTLLLQVGSRLLIQLFMLGRKYP